MKSFNDLTTLQKLEYKLATSANSYKIYKLLKAAEIEGKKEEAYNLLNHYKFTN